MSVMGLFLKLKILPILQKYNVISCKSLKPLSNYHRLCLSVIIPHASTDVLINPSIVPYSNYLYSIAFFSCYGIHFKFFLFFLYSLYHIRNDIPGIFINKIVYSSIIHSSWIFFPEFSLSYLAWIHVILHYYKSFKFIFFFCQVKSPAPIVITINCSNFRSSKF